MKATISNVRISAICAVVPSRISKFEDEIKEYPFPERSSRKLAKVMGYKEHRIAPANVSLCDMPEFAVNQLINNDIIRKEDVDALVFVSHQHEYPTPGNSKVLHGRLNLPTSIHCVDLYENCSGFISGLFSACSVLKATDEIKKVLLVTSNVGTCYLNIKDRNTYPLMGDAASVTLIEKTNNPEDNMAFSFYHDGSQFETLIVPAGGMKLPASKDTAVQLQDKFGNYRSLNDLHMDGAKVFNFVMEHVPALINDLCKYSGIAKSDIFCHLTHQPNKFLVQKLAELINAGESREITVFDNIVENFGNSSSTTIPVNICFNLRDKIVQEKLTVCMSAFGAGMTACGVTTDLGPLSFCALEEFKCD